MTGTEKVLLGVLGVALVGGVYYLATSGDNSPGGNQGGNEKLDDKILKMIEAEKKAGEFTRIIGGTPTKFVVTPTGHAVNKETGQKTALVGYKKPGSS